MVRTVKDSSLDISGFAMEIMIGDAHLPRMWVEKHPDKPSEVRSPTTRKLMIRHYMNCADRILCQWLQSLGNGKYIVRIYNTYLQKLPCSGRVTI